MSKLDRFLFSKELLDVWPGLSALALDRTFSDHSPILLKTAVIDFGPTPFRFFNAWLSIEGFSALVVNSWNQVGISDSSSTVLKDKLKRLKNHIKVWIHQRDSGPGSLKSLKEKMLTWEAIADAGSLSVSDHNNFVAARHNFFQAEAFQAQALKQKSRVRWAIDGD